MTLPAGGAADVSADAPAARRADGLTFSRRTALTHLQTNEPLLAPVIEAAGPFTVRTEAPVDPFAYLLRSIVFQQLHGAAAATIHRRVLDRFGGAVPSPEALLAIDEAELRAAGLSGNKTASIRDLAQHALDGLLPIGDELYQTSDLELVQRLTAVRGIGPWTVHMLLLFQLGRPDVLPTGDFAVREGWRLLTGRAKQPTPTQFRAETEHWRPYRSVASWYMWRVVDLARSGELPLRPTTG